MEWTSKAQEVLNKIRRYRDDSDGWKIAKKSAEVTVWEKTSPDWNGMLYKAEGEMKADPETVFSYIDPSPSSPRSQWDKAIKELQIVDQIDEKIAVVRTITHNAFGGLISSRDFTDLVCNEHTEKYIATNAEGVDHPSCPPSSEFVRGTNHPCAIICFKVPGEPKKTKVMSYIQTDLGGMLPRALVENALPSNQLDFFAALTKALKDGGHWDGKESNGIN